MPTRRWRSIATLCAAVVTIGACGDGGSSSRDTLPAPGTSPLPAVEVHDLGNGGVVPLRGLLPSTKPLLLWFWAPH